MATKAVKLPSGNWRARVQVIGENGKRTYKSFTAPSKREATFLATQYEQTGRGLPAVRDTTVGMAIDGYINDRTAVLSPSTIREYRRMRKNYLQSIMPVRLRDLSLSQIQRAVNADAKSVSPKTVRNAYGLLTAALAVSAPDMNLREINLPQRIKVEINVPEDDAVQRLIARTHGTALCSAILLGAFGGLRRSEIAALMTGDIDKSKHAVSITKAMVLDEHGKWVIKPPKTYAGTRTVDIPAFVIQEVMAHASKHSIYLLGLVPDSVTNQFCAARNAAGLKCRFHDLRHYTASIMHALGVPDKYAMEIMGHSTPDMLNRVYQHTMRSKRAEVTKRVVDYFEKCDTICDTGKSKP